VVARYHAESTQPFDLLRCIGQDSVGALQPLESQMSYLID
jgi:serine/threonine-protein kinase HipA